MKGSGKLGTPEAPLLRDEEVNQQLPPSV